MSMGMRTRLIIDKDKDVDYEDDNYHDDNDYCDSDNNNDYNTVIKMINDDNLPHSLPYSSPQSGLHAEPL